MERKDELLIAAEHLARTRGYDAFSYADLAIDVGIRKASIHHHFSRKSDLALALIERYRDAFDQALIEIERESANAGQRLDRFLGFYRTALQGGTSLCLCVAFSAGRESLSDPVLRELNAFHDHARSWLTTTFERGVQDQTIVSVGNPLEESAAALALVEGAQLLARAAGSLDPFDTSVQSLRARVTG